MTFHPASHRGDGSSLSDRRSVKTRVVLSARFSQMTGSPFPCLCSRLSLLHMDGPAAEPSPSHTKCNVL